MAVIDELVIKISSDIKGATAGIAAVDKSVSRMESNINKSTQSIRNATGKMAKSFVLLGAAAAAALGGLGFVMTRQSSEMEAYMTTLEQLFGAQDVAAEKMRWLLEFAKSTPFELPGLIEATTKLKAYGIDAEDVLKGLGDTASAMGKPINMAVEALADAQTGEFERLKEFGIKAIQITASNAATLGVSMAAVGQTALTSTDKFGKQRVDVIDRNNREVITSTLMSIWNTKYAGGMAKQATTMKGMVSNIKDTMFQASLSIMGFDASIGTFRPDSLFVKVKSAVDDVLGYLNQIDFDVVASKVEAAVNSIIGFISKLYSDLQPTIENLKSIFTSIIGIVGDLFGAFTEGQSGTVTLTGAINMLTGALAAVFRWIDKHPEVSKLIVTIGLAAAAFAYLVPIVTSIITIVTTLGAAVSAVSAFFAAGGTIISGVGIVIAAIGGPITIIIAAIALLAAAWATNLFGIRDITKNILSWIEARFYDLVNFLGPLIALWINSYIKSFNALVPYLNKAGLDLNTVAEIQFTKLEKTVADTAVSIAESTNDISESIEAVETDIENTVADASVSFQGLGDAVEDTALKMNASMAYAGVTRADLAKRAEDITSGVITPAEMVQAIPDQIGQEPMVDVVNQQKTTNQKLDKLTEISGKLDSLKIEVNNYVTNNVKSGGTVPGGSVRGSTAVDAAKAAGTIRRALPTGISPLPSYVSLFR